MWIISLIAGGVLLGSLICVLSYKNYSSSKKIIVPSLFLIKKFTKKINTEKRTFPPRLLIELLFLILLGHALYEIYNNEESNIELVVLDNSLSQSSLISQEKNYSRLRKGIDAYLNANHSAKYYKLITLPQQKISKFDTEKLYTFSELEEELKNQIPSTLPSNLSKELLSKIKEEPFRSISIITDKDLQLQNSMFSSNELRIFGGFESATNLSISNVTYAKVEQKRVLNIEVFNSGQGSSKAEILVTSLLSNKKLAEKKVIELGQEKTNKISYDISGNFSANEIIKVELKDLLRPDSISEDNIWFVKFDKGIKDKIDLVSDDPSASDLVNSIPESLRGTVSLHSTVNYKEPSADTSLSIFYKSALPKKIATPTLSILPTSLGNELEAIGVSENTLVTSWDERSSLTTYLKFDSMIIPRAIVFKQPQWANSAISNKSGSILLQGIKDGHKIVISGIELLPFDAKRKSTIDILLLNTLSLLKDNKVVQSERQYNQAEFQSVNCLYNTKGCALDSEFLERGGYEVVFKNAGKEVLVVNNGSTNESDTYQQKIINIDLRNYKKNNDLIKIKSLPLSLYIALALLFIEMLIIFIAKTELDWSWFKGKKIKECFLELFSWSLS